MADSTQITVAACVITHNRPAELEDTMASVTEQGFDEVLVCDMASTEPARVLRDERLIRYDENLGYPVGRNRLAAEARSEVIVFIDDDAVFLTDDAAAIVRRCFAAHPNLGAIAGRVLRSDGGTVPYEHPFRGDPTEADVARQCGYFVGAVHAVRRSAWIDAGGLDERYFYSTEELDLSFALLRRGYSIWYEPALVVEHRPSPRGRVEKPELPALRMRNRLLLLRRHLPWGVAAVHALIWSARTYCEARRTGDTGPWRRSWREGLRASVVREPIGHRQLLEIHRLGGRVLW